MPILTGSRFIDHKSISIWMSPSLTSYWRWRTSLSRSFLNRRKRLELYLKIVRSEEITITTGECSKLIMILNIPNSHLIFNLILSTPCFLVIRIWYWGRSLYALFLSKPNSLVLCFKLLGRNTSFDLNNNNKKSPLLCIIFFKIISLKLFLAGLPRHKIHWLHPSYSGL